MRFDATRYGLGMRDLAWLARLLLPYGSATKRNSPGVSLRATHKNYIELLKAIEADNPTGDLFIITDNLSSHNSLETRTWLADHPRLQHAFIPKGARLG